MWSQQVRIKEVRLYTHPDCEKWKKCLEGAIYVTHESVMSVKTSTFESWKKTKKYLLIDSLRNKCVHYRVQEFEIIGHSEHVRSKLIEYSLLTVKKKISHDNNSLEIQAKSCDFILNPLSTVARLLDAPDWAAVLPISCIGCCGKV